MNPEIWTLMQDDEIEKLVRELAGNEGLTLKAFSTVAIPLNLEEPPGGLILAIDAEANFSNYLSIIKRFQKNFITLDIIVFGSEKSREIIEREREAGVDLYIPKPVATEDFFARATHLVSLKRLKSSSGIIGRSGTLYEMLETILQVAPTEVTVLIEGESGSGKELSAKAIHLMSRRRDKPFEVINCGALAEGVLESELFGHERGSFTGAVSQRIGLFERANKGTLFLDEVGEMSLNMQVRLLRVIETGEFLRVGGTAKVHTDVRLIAATNRELETAIEKGEFRKDLYYRLKVVQVRIPPLRARQDDIPILVNNFIRRSARKHGKKVHGIERGGLEILISYPWPGNVRELSNVIDNLIVLSRGNTIRREAIEKRLQERLPTESFPDLPVHVHRSREEMEREIILNSLLSLNNDVKEILRILKGEESPAQKPLRKWMEVKEDAPPPEPRSLNAIEREAICGALIANGGNRRKAAKQLGMSERTLYRRLKEHKID